MILIHLAIVLFVMLVLAFGGFALIVTSVRSHWSHGNCPKCGYDLINHRPADRCPECGELMAALADGYIERHPWRFVAGLLLLALAGIALITDFLLAIQII